MYEQKYEEAIDSLKNNHPELKGVKFEICDGVLEYSLGSCPEGIEINMNQMQEKVNQFLGQRKFRVIYTGYKTIYAISEEQVREFAVRDGYKVSSHISKIENYGN